MTPHSFPSRQKYFLGVGKYGRRTFVGRDSLIKEVDKSLTLGDLSTAVVGIGGIGGRGPVYPVADGFDRFWKLVCCDCMPPC